MAMNTDSWKTAAVERDAKALARFLNATGRGWRGVWADEMPDGLATARTRIPSKDAKHRAYDNASHIGRLLDWDTPRCSTILDLIAALDRCGYGSKLAPANRRAIEWVIRRSIPANPGGASR